MGEVINKDIKEVEESVIRIESTAIGQFNKFREVQGCSHLIDLDEHLKDRLYDTK